MNKKLSAILQINTYLVNPSSTFRITPKSNDLEFILEYYCEAQDYFSNKYNLSPAHEEVVSAVKHIHRARHWI